MLLYLTILLTDPLFDTKSTLYTYTLQLCSYTPKNLVPGKRSGLPVEINIPLLFPFPLSTDTNLSLHTAVKRYSGHINFVKQSNLIEFDMVLVTQLTLAIM